MANVIYRDIDCANGHELIYAILSRLVLNGWATVASSDGTTRGTSAPGSAAALNNTDAWWLVNHVASGRKVGIQRKADSNAWTIKVTPPGYSLTTGDATTMDAHASYTKNIVNDAQRYPSSGTTTSKLHLVVDDARCAFYAGARRSPHGSGDNVFHLLVEAFTDVTWSANPDACYYCTAFGDDNSASSYLFAAGGGNYLWHRLGITDEQWNALNAFENPGGVCGTGTAAPSGEDQLLELRMMNNSNPYILFGKSGLIRGLWPYRSPPLGVDSGGTLNWAAMGHIAVPNDGTALGS